MARNGISADKGQCVVNVFITMRGIGNESVFFLLSSCQWTIFKANYIIYCAIFMFQESCTLATILQLSTCKHASDQSWQTTFVFDSLLQQKMLMLTSCSNFTTIQV